MEDIGKLPTQTQCLYSAFLQKREKLTVKFTGVAQFILPLPSEV